MYIDPKIAQHLNDHLNSTSSGNVSIDWDGIFADDDGKVDERLVTFITELVIEGIAANTGQNSRMLDELMTRSYSGYLPGTLIDTIRGIQDNLSEIEDSLSLSQDNFNSLMDNYLKERLPDPTKPIDEELGDE